MRVYYAHCQAIYGTPQEDRDVELLTRLGFGVVNPALVPDADMQFYLRMVADCDAVAFRALPDGRITTGVFQEIQEARRLGYPVFELPSNLVGREMSHQETRGYLAEVGFR